jgi:hypothetical protein
MQKENFMSSSASPGESTVHVTPGRDTIWRSLLIGLLPLLLLASISFITIVLVVLLRQIFVAAGFLVQQRNELIMLGVGLTVAIIVYAVTVWRILRNMDNWQQTGMQRRTRIVLWTLTGTAIIVLLPVIVAALFPQHPAP